MRALLSFIAGTMLLNLSVQAAKKGNTDGLKAIDNDLEVPAHPRAWEKQKMEDPNMQIGPTRPGFEKNPTEYRPESISEEN